MDQPRWGYSNPFYKRRGIPAFSATVRLVTTERQRGSPLICMRNLHGRQNVRRTRYAVSMNATGQVVRENLGKSAREILQSTVSQLSIAQIGRDAVQSSFAPIAKELMPYVKDYPWVLFCIRELSVLAVTMCLMLFFKRVLMSVAERMTDIEDFAVEKAESSEEWRVNLVITLVEIFLGALQNLLGVLMWTAVIVRYMIMILGDDVYFKFCFGPLKLLFATVLIWYCFLSSNRVFTMLQQKVRRLSFPEATEKRIAYVQTLGGVTNALVALLSLALIQYYIGWNLQSLVAVGGIGGIALGFAAQNVLENVFGGFVLFTARPFEVGHYVQVDKVSGFVARLGPYQTQLSNADGTTKTVNNSMFIKNVITNESRKTSETYSYDYELPWYFVPNAGLIVSEVRSMLYANPLVEKNDPAGEPRVTTTSFKFASSFTLHLEYLLHYASNTLIDDNNQKIMMSIAYIIDRHTPPYELRTLM